MPNPLNTFTKPLQIGAKVAFGAVQGIQHALKGQNDDGAQHEQEQPQKQQEEQLKARPSAVAQRKTAQRRNTRPTRGRST